MKNVLKAELVGLDIEVTESPNQNLVGISGKIVYETRNTIIIKNRKTQTLMKNQITFKTKINNQRYKIDGKKLNQRPEKRIK